MILTLIIIGSILLLLFIFLHLLDLECIRINKLKRIVNSDCHTRTKFSYRTKMMGTYLYVFVDNSKAYTINEFGSVCGYKNIS